MMRCVHLTFWQLIFVFSLKVYAITWNFDQAGNSQGWRAQESIASGAPSTTLSMLRSEVRNGVWRILLPPYESGGTPTAALISPPMQYNSILFDRVAIRFRVVHTSPHEGQLGLSWTNEGNRDTPGMQPIGEEHRIFYLSQEETYTTDWQEVAIGNLRTRPVSVRGKQYDLFWTGELIDIRIDMVLSKDRPVGSVGGSTDWPEAIEVDRVVLTGVEEQLRGELPPPEFLETTPFGDLFSAPVFNPLEKKGISSFPWTLTAALGDLDGDGDVDLVTTFSDGGSKGWISAFNDGKGHFEHPLVKKVAGSLFLLFGGELETDGRMDAMLYTTSPSSHIDLLGYEADSDWVVRQTFPDSYPLGLADADGDGRMDVWMMADLSQGKGSISVFLNDGIGDFQQRDPVIFNPPAQGFRPTRLVRHFQHGERTAVVWAPPSDKLPAGFVLNYLNKAGEASQEALDTRIDPMQILYAGDYDTDGDVDLVVSKEVFGRVATFKGIEFMENAGGGIYQTTIWYESVELTHDVVFCDLNDDQILDPVFVDSNLHNPAVVVSLGVEDGLPIQEGRYLLRGQGGAVLGGDVDGDNDVDLVVLEKALEGQGGVHVLLNRLHDRQTSVTTASTAAQPVAPVLSPAYPNPFNAATLIPVSLPVDARQVRLEIYDLLGQPVKRLVDGPLSAGAHLVRWDGTDDQSVALASGVYLFRLCAGDADAVGRVVLVR